MQNFLGAELFLDFDSHLTGGVLDSNAPQKWKDLVNGATYTKDNKTYVWKGIKYTEGTINESLLAYFVYYYSYQNSINSSVGQVVVNPRNAENINPSEHLTNVWNIFIRNYQGSTSTNCLQFYNNFDFFENNNTYVSLMQFVIDKKENYVNINGPMLNYKNRFGL
jgi:hypothetical protein